MEKYGNDILLQTHQVFEILIKFLDWILRPPTYYGSLERFVRGYLRKPPSEEVHAAILCIGGLDAVVQLADTKTYMERIKEADKFLFPISDHPRDSSSLLRRAVGSDPISRLRQEDLQLLLPRLPALNDIWRRTGEVLLLERKVIHRREDIMDFAQALTELMRPETTLADELYDGHILWHALSDPDFGACGDAL
jgi:hypothetical protein